MKIPRRDFIKKTALAGGGLLLSTYLPSLKGSEVAPTQETSDFFNLFVKIDASGEVTIMMPAQEIGQGIATGLSMCAAEEMELDWGKIRVEFIPFDNNYPKVEERYTHISVGGSYTMRSRWLPIRKMGATAKEMLRQAAANHWSVPLKECRAKNGEIIHESTGSILSYGSLAGRASLLDVPQNPPLKDREKFSLMGKSLGSLKTPKVVKGDYTYSMDLKIPGMLYAAILRTPVKGGKIAEVDDTAAGAIPGVNQVLTIREIKTPVIWMGGFKDGVVVLADSTWAAFQGKKALKVKWEEGPNSLRNSDDLTDEFRNTENLMTRTRGDLAQGMVNSVRTVSAVYESPYLAHGLMEPLNAIAHVKENGQVEIWAGTQSPKHVAEHIEKELGIKADQVIFHPYPSGGGFGRRFFTDFVMEAVMISSQINVPVKLVWSREDEIQHGRFHPFRQDHHTVGLNEEGNILAWDFKGFTTHEWGASVRLPYANSNISIQSNFLKNVLVDYGSWRSVSRHLEAFSRESFIDEIAHSIGKDPIKYRLQQLSRSSLSEPKNERQKRQSNRVEEYKKQLKAVIKKVAEMASWGRSLHPGYGLGVAAAEYNDSYCAQIAEVEVTDGKLTVHKVYCVLDCGLVINPNLVRAQIEGSVMWALSPVLHGGINIENGRITQSNFHDLKQLRIDEAPEVEIHLMVSDRDPVGTGEPAVPPLAPAVLNAIFDATGKRIRNLHVTPELVKI